MNLGALAAAAGILILILGLGGLNRWPKPWDTLAAALLPIGFLILLAGVTEMVVPGFFP